MPNPDWVYNPDDWECTYSWEDRDDLADHEEIEFSGIQRFATLIQGPDKFCAYINNEYVWFDSRADAEAAFKASSPQETE